MALKSCPFCGADLATADRSSVSNWVRCVFCGAQGPVARDADAARAEWNKRPVETIAVEVERDRFRTLEVERDRFRTQRDDEARMHAACLTIAETGQLWGDAATPSPAMVAVYELHRERNDLLRRLGELK